MTDTVNDSAHVAPQARPATFAFAVLGSKTRKGGTLSHVSTGIVSKGHPVAGVGDIVTYPDGSQSRIISGAGVASVYKGKPLALAGSVTDNGDVINRWTVNQT